MKKIFVANLKMNLNLDDINNYIEELNNSKINLSNLIIAPSSLYLPYFLKNDAEYKLAIQNISSFNEGSYTGQISAKQASSIGINYSIVGHFESKKYLKETEKDINKKVKLLLANNISPIICIGDNKEEKESYQTNKVLKLQIQEILNRLSKEDISNIYIAYEPIYAIGKNIIPDISDIEAIVMYIKMLVLKNKNAEVKVLYGGSVNLDNIKELNKIKNLDGYLIGGSSLNPSKFIELIGKIS